MGALKPTVSAAARVGLCDRNVRYCRRCRRGYGASSGATWSMTGVHCAELTQTTRCDPWRTYTIIVIKLPIKAFWPTGRHVAAAPAGKRVVFRSGLYRQPGSAFATAAAPHNQVPAVRRGRIVGPSHGTRQCPGRSAAWQSQADAGSGSGAASAAASGSSGISRPKFIVNSPRTPAAITWWMKSSLSSTGSGMTNG